MTVVNNFSLSYPRINITEYFYFLFFKLVIYHIPIGIIVIPSTQSLVKYSIALVSDTDLISD